MALPPVVELEASCCYSDSKTIPAGLSPLEMRRACHRPRWALRGLAKDSVGSSKLPRRFEIRDGKPLCPPTPVLW